MAGKRVGLSVYAKAALRDMLKGMELAVCWAYQPVGD
jgi:hypothetical protein